MATGKVTAFEEDMLKLIFQNVAVPNIGDVTGLRGSTVAGSLYLSLHTASPGSAGDQTTNECTLPGYARMAIARASGAGGFTLTGLSKIAQTDVDPAFAQTTSGEQTLSYMGVGTAASGAGRLLYFGPLNRPLSTTDVSVVLNADNRLYLYDLNLGDG